MAAARGRPREPSKRLWEVTVAGANVWLACGTTGMVLYKQTEGRRQLQKLKKELDVGAAERVACKFVGIDPDDPEIAGLLEHIRGTFVNHNRSRSRSRSRSRNRSPERARQHGQPQRAAERAAERADATTTGVFARAKAIALTHLPTHPPPHHYHHHITTTNHHSSTHHATHRPTHPDPLALSSVDTLGLAHDLLGECNWFVEQAAAESEPPVKRRLSACVVV